MKPTIKERIEREKRPILPILLFFEDIVGDFRDLFGTELETIDVGIGVAYEFESRCKCQADRQ